VPPRTPSGKPARRTRTNSGIVTLLRRTKGAITGPLHAKPSFLVIGAARAGTGTLFWMLRRHPNVIAAVGYEVHYFDGPRRRLGQGWYRSLFPTRWRLAAAERNGTRPAISGEKSPFYLASTAAPRRVHAVVPDARLVCLLRDPAARAVSHWGLRSWKGVETRTFAEAVEDELGPGWMNDPAAVGERLRDDDEADANVSGTGGVRVGRKRSSARAPERYVARGVYVDQLRRWHAVFPREQLLVLESEAFFADPPKVFDDVCDHLGIPRVSPNPPKHRHGNQRPREAEPEVVEALRKLYRAPNRRLADYLGREFSWAASDD
jgi:hypothetical protein